MPFSNRHEILEPGCINILKACISSTRFKLFSQDGINKETLSSTLERIVLEKELLEKRNEDCAQRLLLEALVLLCKLNRQEQTLLESARSVYIYSQEKEEHLTHWCRKDVLENALFRDKNQLLLKLMSKNVEPHSGDIIRELDKRREDLLLGCKEAHPQIIKFTQKIFHSTCKFLPNDYTLWYSAIQLKGSWRD